MVGGLVPKQVLMRHISTQRFLCGQCSAGILYVAKGWKSLKELDLVYRRMKL